MPQATRSWICLALLLALGASLVHVTSARCPFGHDSMPGRRLMADDTGSSGMDHAKRAALAEAAAKIDYDAVAADIEAMLTQSQPFWPADFGNYGGLLIRQAWHCAGTYRKWDGRGGCDGGRQRFDPELSYPDNINLDKSKTLLLPIKLKYGAGLSWGDLIILAGNVAISSMGGPVLGFCAGRLDDTDGYTSLELGPSLEQRQVAPCDVQGNCQSPLGPSVFGNIYVDPGGFMGSGDPGNATAANIRDVFSRMGFNDTETVALVGGGHAFGKAHGACTTGAGPAPDQDPFNPWPGTCVGNGPEMGKGGNQWTSGYEGQWTDTPTTWGNDYFQNLFKYDYVPSRSPAGNPQFKPQAKPGGPTPAPGLFMLVTDVANIKDPAYLALSQQYANNLTALEHDFAHAWYKLVTEDMGPATRCIGNKVPPPQPFQDPLPPAPDKLADFAAVRAEIVKALTQPDPALEPDMVDGRPYYGAWFVQLAWQCASTFRATDYRGGCNGAKIRFSPQKDWPVNVAMDQVLQVLSKVKAKFPPEKGALSWADLIVLAGQTAIEEAGGSKMQFCGGRVDAPDGSGYENLGPRSYNDTFVEVRDNMKVMGVSPQEMVALAGRLRSPARQKRLGYGGSWSSAPDRLSNDYYLLLLNQTWVLQNTSTPAAMIVQAAELRDMYGLNGSLALHNLSENSTEAKAVGGEFYMLPTDLALRYNTTWRAIVEEYASDSELFHTAFASAWSKLMNADRFDGPAGNLCPGGGITGRSTIAMGPTVPDVFVFGPAV